jgi:hypothetical protein
VFDAYNFILNFLLKKWSGKKISTNVLFKRINITEEAKINISVYENFTLVCFEILSIL